MLAIKNLVKDYKNENGDFRALSDISLSFPSVQFVAILGPSGCGKTTLLNLIGGLDSITDGDIIADGVSLKNCKSKELDSYRNNEIGFIFQDYFLITNFSALDNVKIGLAVRDYKAKEVDEKALSALEKIGISDLKDKKPSQLSGGQQQRVAIARALATDPRIILADEPTGALDSKNSEEIMNTLKEISKSRLVIMVTHNEELANKYADRIIRLKDGVVVSDSLQTEEVQVTQEECESYVKRKSRLPLLMNIKMAFHNIFTKKWKTIITCVTSSIGMIGLAFVFSMNTGFSEYTTELSSVTASSLPIVLTSYTTTTQTDTETYAEVNASVSYPDVEEIYPKVSLNSITNTSYYYNNFTPKFINYLDTLVDEGLASEYVINYSFSSAMNLMTEFPASIDGESDGYIGTVNTSITSSNSLASSAGLPTNIFHVLYGDLDDYDLLTGKLPQAKNEMVLVVDQYNSVSFSILRALGFYNSSDSEDDVKNAELETKVTPISFSDVIGKEYKVFLNDEYFSFSSVASVTDGLGINRDMYTYSSPSSSQLAEFYENNGTTLTITGIIRAKSTSNYTLLSPSLCYMPELQNDFYQENLDSEFCTNLANNFYVRFPEGSDQMTFISELEEIFDSYMESDSSILPSTELNSFFNTYFYNWDITSGRTYSGLSNLISQAMTYGSDIVPDSMRGIDLSDEDSINGIIDEITTALQNGVIDTVYQYMLGIAACLSGYGLISSIIIIPTSLITRNDILDAIDSFNEIVSDSEVHASSSSEQIYYADANVSWMIENVAQTIELATTILIIFAIICLVITIAMIAVTTSKNVMEREREIGLLRALGSRKFDIALLFEIEALTLGLFTGVLGSLFGYVLTFPVNSLLASYYPNYNVENICHFTFEHALIIIALSLIIAFLAALIPSYQASRKNPVDCLKPDE